MRAFKVIVATPKDIDILVRFRHEMFEDMGHRTAEEHRLNDVQFRRWAILKMKERKLRCFLVKAPDGESAGGGTVWLREVQPSPGRRAGVMPYLMSMYTEPKFRRKGVATLVVREAERWARDRGYPLMNLHASRKGRKVYAKLGWKRTWEMVTELV